MKAAEEKPAANQAGKSNSFLQKEVGQHFFGSDLRDPAFFLATAKPAGIQAKLTIGAPNDKYEKEADAMADKVVQGSASQPPTASGPEVNTLQKCPECEKEANLVTQRKCAECEKEASLQAKGKGNAASGTANLENQLAATAGGGEPLPEVTRKEMESSFGADFSSVRIHRDSAAAEMSKSIRAHAFTQGSDIFFNQGKYDAESKAGKHLLAHELTHVVHQGGAGKIQRDLQEPENSEVANQMAYDKLREYLRSADLEKSKALVSTMTPEQKSYVLASDVFKNLATRESTGGADFGDNSITQLLDAFLSDGYQNLYACLTWMFYEFDADEDNDANFLQIIRKHSNEAQKAFVRANMKTQFVEFVGDKGMAEIVKLLGGPLDHKLKWLKAEGVDSWDLAREVIIDHLSKSPITRTESKNIFTGNGEDLRWYFGRKIDVGDNEMVRMVNLLEFEFSQKLDWMIYEDTNVSLVRHVLISTPPEEVKAVLANETLLKSLEGSVGNDFKMLEITMKQVAGLTGDAAETISVLGTTITEELTLATAETNRSGTGLALVKRGAFLVEAAMDQLRILLPNPEVPQENKQGWAGELKYCTDLLKMYFKYPEDEVEHPQSYQNQIASNDKAIGGQVQATFIQAQGISPTPLGGPTVGNAIRSLTRLPPPEAPVYWAEGSAAFPKPTLPTPQPWYSLARPEISLLPPVAPHLEPSPGEGKPTWDRYDWQTETGKRLDLLRRQIEEMKTWRRVAPTPQTEPGKEEGSQQERRRNKICYRNSIIMMIQGQTFVPMAVGATPPEFRIPACMLRTETGTTDNDFIFRNIAVARFIVRGREEYIAAANPEFNIHSEDEIFRLAEQRFGSGRYTLDALFSERRPCYRCTGNIYLMPRTPEFRVYCIINNDYAWWQIQQQYAGGLL